jgi:hypothetical protein
MNEDEAREKIEALEAAVTTLTRSMEVALGAIKELIAYVAIKEGLPDA